MHAQQLFVAVLMAAGAALSEARPAGDVDARAIGSLECNLARAKIVGAMALTRGITNSIADPTVKDATVAGLDAAGAGIKDIAKALISGGAPPPEARDAVKAGLTASTTALAGGDQADDAVANATKTLKAAVDAGNDVVAKC